MRGPGPLRTVLSPTALVAALAGVLGCGDEGVGPPVTEGPGIEVVVAGLAPLAPEEDGAYEVWLVDGKGSVRSAGRLDGEDPGHATVTSPLEEPVYLMITVEPPGDDVGRPSAAKLMGGRFGADGNAALSVTGYLTPVGMPLEDRPGVHVLGSVADPGGPHDDAGLWLVDSRVDSLDASFFQTLTPLTRGWTYEGWVVRDHETSEEVWASYGRFVPNNLRKTRFRDDTGPGPFSGFADYERALVSELNFPGDDWISNPLGHPVPGGLSLPFDLNGDEVAGEPSRWVHVITIEPNDAPDGIRTGEPWEARPFFLRPYRNAIGEDPPDRPRTIGFFPEELPVGTARLLPSGA